MLSFLCSKIVIVYLFAKLLKPPQYIRVYSTPRPKAMYMVFLIIIVIINIMEPLICSMQVLLIKPWLIEQGKKVAKVNDNDPAGNKPQNIPTSSVKHLTVFFGQEEEKISFWYFQSCFPRSHLMESQTLWTFLRASCVH